MITMNPKPNPIKACTLALTMFLGTGAAQAAQTAQPMDDTRISDAVSSDLLYHWSIDANRIDVSVSEGVVTLKGEVRTLIAKRRAIDIAQSIRGVRSVVDRMTVRPTDRADRQIIADIRTNLRSNPATESYEVAIDARNGQITLSGSVSSMTEKWLAEDVAAGVDGVRSITNDIRVTPPVDREDSEIRADVNQRLSRSVLVNALPVIVRVNDGEVRLSGTVGSATERINAMRLAWVEGVRNVDASDLVIAFYSETDERKMNPDAPNYTDEDISEAVADALSYDPRVNRFDVHVRTNGGHVTLTGSVPTRNASDAAERAARLTSGVTGVTNIVSVRPGTWMDDADLARTVESAIERDALLSGRDINAYVDDGVVTLIGSVSTFTERQRATQVAGDVVGVTTVINHVSFDDDWNWRPDSEIADSVESQLFWSPFVDSDDIIVSVDNGVVTLSGTVDNYNEMTAARRNALEGGAREVRLNLNIER